MGAPRRRDVSLTGFHRAGQRVAEARDLGGKYFHAVVHAAEQVGDENGVDVSSHEGLQCGAGN